ncbi:MAG: ABC transporter permease [Candidatus Eremiobacteraeota bacterium]|nr:ABC transporter permease [Candidatus Eremiobacteraeota bacterium]
MKKITDNTPDKPRGGGKGSESAFKVGFLIIFLAYIAGLVILFLATILFIDFATFKTCVMDPEIQFSVKLSFITATITTIIVIIIGVPSAYALSRYKIPAGTFVDTILDLPIVLPPPVVGICLLILFRHPIVKQMVATTGVEFVYTQRGIILAQFAIASAFGIRAMKAAFDSINPRLEQVARTLGCNSFQTFLHVTLPLAKNGLIAGIVMTWARSIAEFGPILFFCGATRMKTEVMPVALFLNLSIGNIEMTVAICIVMMMVSTITLIIFKKLGGKGYLW